MAFASPYAILNMRSMTREPKRYSAAQLDSFVRQVLAKLGVPDEDAGFAADALVHADLLGVDTHGVRRLEGHPGFLPGLERGLINPAPHVHAIRETAATVLLDGDKGLGGVVATRAMRLAIKKAGTAGIGAVAVMNTHHLGIACHYAMMALDHGMIGIVTNNAYPQMAPAGGAKASLGTNPFSIAAPSGDRPAFILDIASSVVSYGRIVLAHEAGTALPDGWLIDKDGEPSTDPSDIESGGALLPLGSRPQMGSYKGTGLAIMADVLGGVLSGAGYSSIMDPTSWTTGQFMLAIDVEAFRPLLDFQRMMDAMVDALRSTPSLSGVHRVTVPGERKLATRTERRRTGIMLPPSVVESLNRVGRRYGVSLTSDCPDST